MENRVVCPDFERTAIHFSAAFLAAGVAAYFLKNTEEYAFSVPWPADPNRRTAVLFESRVSPLGTVMKHYACSLYEKNGTFLQSLASRHEIQPLIGIAHVYDCQQKENDVYKTCFLVETLRSSYILRDCLFKPKADPDSPGEPSDCRLYAPWEKPFHGHFPAQHRKIRQRA